MSAQESALYQRPGIHQPIADGLYQMLKIGERAPDFELPDQNGQNQRLSTLLQHGALVLYFYPADFTPVCSREACTFRDLQPALATASISIIGISPQDSASHVRFSARHGLTFPLLADTDKRVIRAYGCDGPLGLGVRRVSYLIGQDGRIMKRAQAAFRITPHAMLARNAMGLTASAESREQR